MNYPYYASQQTHGFLHLILTKTLHLVFCLGFKKDQMIVVWDRIKILTKVQPFQNMCRLCHKKNRIAATCLNKSNFKNFSFSPKQYKVWEKQFFL